MHSSVEVLEDQQYSQHWQISMPPAIARVRVIGMSDLLSFESAYEFLGQRLELPPYLLACLT